MILGFAALMSGVIACSSQNSPPHPPPFPTIFDERPFQMNCADYPPHLAPGVKAFMTFSPRAPYARARLDTLEVPLNQVPALTIAAEPTNWIKIAGVKEDHWTFRYCAMGQGNTADEATGYLQKISMQRVGSLLTLNDTETRGLTGGQGTLILDAPAEAPVTVHSDAAVEVHDMAGPVRIAAPRGRAVILNTSGLVDVSATVIDFAGSQGSVSLDAAWDIDIKLTAQRFRGTLSAHAQRQVHMFVPTGFQTPIEVLVNRPRDFACRADFCAKIKKDRVNTLYRFTYGDLENSPDHLAMRSENAQVTLETAP